MNVNNTCTLVIVILFLTSFEKALEPIGYRMIQRDLYEMPDSYLPTFLFQEPLILKSNLVGLKVLTEKLVGSDYVAKYSFDSLGLLLTSDIKSRDYLNKSEFEYDDMSRLVKVRNVTNYGEVKEQNNFSFFL